MKFDLSRIKLTKKDELLKTTLPKKLDEDLAYFMGVHTGDGFMNYYDDKKDYRLSYDGHIINEIGWYRQILAPLIKKLFNRDVKIQMTSTGTAKIEIHSKSIFLFLHEICGITLSPKDKMDIPPLIKEADISIKRAFLKGIADTDFSLVFKRKNKSYPVIDFQTNNEILLISVSNMLRNLNFKHHYGSRYKKRGDRSYRNYYLQINGRTSLEKWMREIGFKSENQLTKYEIWQKHGFLPSGTNICQRKAILCEEVDIGKFYKASINT
ncbi:hypothetical protein HYV82_05850 [Candidatus Woesearchaeota archaeon]|nr:hypothetical protein [Candidatus Woesearchaeota archaeon]